jgi:dimethylhistidine N-methyltransferase
LPNDFSCTAPSGRGDVIDAALSGLTASHKTLPPWLFYDQEGCRLFYRITRLPEYYLTRTEMHLLSCYAREMLPPGLRGATLVEFGGSDETKASCLLDLTAGTQVPVFQAYITIDVAAGALEALRLRLAASHPRLTVIPIEADFMQPLMLPNIPGPRIGFFPGSTIGNLDPDAAVRFLRGVHASLGAGSWLLIGADLRKDPAIILPAYNDAAGVTAAFNLNLLVRLNREAAADFDLAGFRHQAVWNDRDSRIEMHLVSRHAQIVHVAGTRITFNSEEMIHTENSYKHTPEAMIELARSGGWRKESVWTDRAGLFAVFLFRYA